jgi:hypothetical protein
MDLLQMVKTHNSRYFERIYEKDNPLSGLCTKCYEPLCRIGKNNTLCEYHWLKGKYDHIKGKISKPKKYPFYKGKLLNLDWKEFINWAILNNEYLKMEEPILSRKNLDDHFNNENFIWMENKDFLRRQALMNGFFDPK